MDDSRNTPKDFGFDFDYWMRLANLNPTAFEELRLNEIENVILSNTSKQLHLRLRRLQFQLDAERARARTPLKACMRFSSMMWDAMLDLNTQLTVHGFNEHMEKTEHASTPNKISATVLPFRKTETNS